MNEDQKRLLELEDKGTRLVTIKGDRYERLRDNRWRRFDGRIVLILDLADSVDGELPWRVEVDGELLKTRFAHPWWAIHSAMRIIVGRVVQ